MNFTDPQPNSPKEVIGRTKLDNRSGKFQVTQLARKKLPGALQSIRKVAKTTDEIKASTQIASDINPMEFKIPKDEILG